VAPAQGIRVVLFADGTVRRRPMRRVRDALLVVAAAGFLGVVFVLAMVPRFA
jgi:hypothetical protein